jgi:hypothetical protein
VANVIKLFSMHLVCFWHNSVKIIKKYDSSGISYAEKSVITLTLGVKFINYGQKCFIALAHVIKRFCP